MKKLLVSDYDKTLKVNYEFKHDFLMKINVHAIKKFIANGNLFMINTGRYFDSIKSEININEIPYNYLACNDGTLLLDNKDNVVREYDIMNPIYNYDYIISVLDFDRLSPIIINDYIVITKDNFYKNPSIADTYYLNYNIVDDKVYLKPLSLDEAIKKFMTKYDSYKLTGWKYEDLLLEYEIHRNDPKIIFSIYNNSELMKDIKKIVKLYDIQYTIFMKRIIFLRHKGITKSTMINEVKDIEKVSKENIYTVGDNYNDLEMLKDFRGYTMPWGKKELKEVCEGITPSIRKLIKRIER